MSTVSTQLQDSNVNYEAANNVRQAAVALTMGGPNTVAQVIKSGTPKPHATISDSTVAAVDRYTPPPGHNMRHYLALDVDRAGKTSTSIVDAIQRYFNIRPRREPIADPKSIASTDSFPTLIIQEAKNVAEDFFPYRFSVNGMVQNQTQPVFHAKAGSLQIRVLSPGVTSVQTPETLPEPPIEVGPLAEKGSYYPPAFAAQMAMDDIRAAYDPSKKMNVIYTGPNLTRSVNETLSSVAETLAPVRAKLAELNPNLGSYSSSPRLVQSPIASGIY